MYGNINSSSYKTSQGAYIDSQTVNNILINPQVKAKMSLNDGWQPYALLGYVANTGNKPKVSAGDVELEADKIDGYVEYGVGINKDFIGTLWSCYAQILGRGGDRSGFSGSLGIKYKF
jgi:outer membrane autotransporter protein